MIHREDIQRAEAEHDPHRAGRGELHRPAAPPLLHQRGRVHITAGWVQLIDGPFAALFNYFIGRKI